MYIVALLVYLLSDNEIAKKIISQSPVIIVVSLLSMQAGYYINDNIFAMLHRGKARVFIPRAFIAAFAGEFTNSFILVFCALYWIFNISMYKSLIMILSQTVVILGIELVLFPISYAIVKYIRVKNDV
jgi:hypothetical protein